MSKRPRSVGGSASSSAGSGGGGGAGGGIGKLSLTAARRSSGNGGNGKRPSSSGGGVRRRRQQQQQQQRWQSAGTSSMSIMDPLATAPINLASSSASSSAAASAASSLKASKASARSRARSSAPSAGEGQRRPRRKSSQPAANAKAGESSTQISNSSSGSSNNKSSNDPPHVRIESLTLHLSALESQRTAKRERLQDLFAQMQSIRSQMTTMEKDLQGLDDEIESVEGQVRRLARNSETGGDGSGGDGEGGQFQQQQQQQQQHHHHHHHPHQQQCETQTTQYEYASTQLSPTQDFGRNDYYYDNEDDDNNNNDEEEEEKKDGETSSCTLDAPPPPPPSSPPLPTTPQGCTMAPPDEMLTDPPLSSACTTGTTGGMTRTRSDGDASLFVRSSGMNAGGELTTDVLVPQPSRSDGDSDDDNNDSTAGRKRSPPPPKNYDDEMDMIVNHYDDDDDDDDDNDDNHEKDIVDGPPPPPPPEFESGGAAGDTYASTLAGTGPMDRSRSTSSDGDVIEISTIHKAAAPEGMVPSGGSSSNRDTRAGRSATTLDNFFSSRSRSTSTGTAGGDHGQKDARRDSDGGVLAYATSAAASAGEAATAPAPSASVSSSSSFSNVGAIGRPNRDDRNASYIQRLAIDNYPWSEQMAHHLRQTFRIQSFRDNQKEIINCTMSGDDAFVIMRTGGGKSLTYQLPALLEGRGQQRKVTLVVSPLISLLRDQEDQMNGFVAGSAVSFMSGMGSSEHAQRWARVRDPNGGICLILCTPEKITKSNKLRSELEKLNNAGRLGRFVIDECHCCCQWGHDFRPDYTKLGILKTHFPSIPLIAVTATASDRVREDCARILRIGTNYQLFRSTANRPNLRYSVRNKPDGSQKVIDDMVDFIKTQHPNDAGIIYTFSKKEAEEVADKLCSGGIVARPYHADVQREHKDMTHRSWMRNETQVVVATIAFGLGINKPDVRFVLHHSLSKSLEGYYQESGRAGRDGLPADCILYYSPKDIYRTIGMIHGSHGEGGFWNMMRYAQAYGDDVLCKKIILEMLGEHGPENLVTILKRGCDRTETREVGAHCGIAATLIGQSGDDMTAAQLVTLWRSKNAPACVKAHPPGTDLNKDECDRLIVTLLLERVFLPKVVFNAYGSNVYIQLGPRGEQLLRSASPQVSVRLPKRKAKASAKKTSTSTKRAASKNTPSPADADENGWIKSSEKKRKSISTGVKSKKPSGRRKNASGIGRNGSGKDRRNDDNDVIILSSSDEEDTKKPALVGNGKKRPARSAKQMASKKIKKDIFDDSSSSESEYEF